ncbi:MAG TPA: S41 family peptidase [Steroidobacteraceae bacterium]|jgi:carboxyl-terminal processing protease|nr:S41 family peptidase [Steroidobacteraceae bacterium]
MAQRARLILALSVGIMLGVSISVTDRVLAERGADDAPPARYTDSAGLPWRDARLLAEVMQRVKEGYVDPVSDHQLMLDATRGMVAALDEHSTFLTPAEYDDMKVSTSGAYAGIGVEVVQGKDGISIIHCMDGSPAQRAGIRTGDTILSIDGRMVDPARQSDGIAHMRGAAGTAIRLLIRRVDTPTPIEFRVVRTEVRLQSVQGQMLTGDVGYLRVTSFTETTGTEMAQVVEQLEHDRGQRIKGFVIDLRNNLGGVLDAAAEVADDFLDHGVIVTANGRTADAKFRIDAKPGDITHGAALVVLVNGSSASASEILAAALHDNQRAKLIGRKTYGKGSVQTIMPLSDGQALKITTSRYFTPSGVSINGVGITPDVVLEGPEQPPADLDSASMTAASLATGALAAGAVPTLALRDPEVAIALHALTSHTGVVARGAAAGASATPAAQ